MYQTLHDDSLIPENDFELSDLLGIFVIFFKFINLSMYDASFQKLSNQMYLNIHYYCIKHHNGAFLMFEILFGRILATFVYENIHFS